MSIRSFTRWRQAPSITPVAMGQPLVNYMDFEHPERNDFVVVSQFRVDEPGGQAKKCILRRYANQRSEVEQPEGDEQLFRTNQFVVATTGLQARVGTITAGAEHFLESKDTAPVDKAEVAASLGKSADQLTGQELPRRWHVRPEILLDLVRHFTVFDVDGPRTVKKVARYQQYRAVVRALDRLRNGATRAEDGECDRRGGLIWHTQGSGKSLTMVFLIRAMRSDPALRRFNVVVVTDRTDLQHQLPEHRRTRWRDCAGRAGLRQGQRAARSAWPRHRDGDDPEVPGHLIHQRRRG